MRVVDLDRLARLQPDRLQPEVVGAHAAADRDEQLVAGQRLAVLQRDRHAAVVARARPPPPRADPQLDAAPLQPLRHLHARERLLARDQAVGRLDQRHARAERGPRLRQLHADDAAAEHEQLAGDLVGRRRLAVRPRLRLGEPGDRRQQRARAGRDDHRLARLVHDRLAVRAADLHPPLAGQPRLPAQQRHAALLQPRQLRGVVELVDHLVAAAQHARRVEPARGRVVRHARHARDLVEQLARAQQRLRRHARPVAALAADQLALDERDRSPALRQLARPRPRRPGRRRSRSRRSRRSRHATSASASSSAAAIRSGRSSCG